MRSSKLDGRLSLCADFVREGSRLLDIGTDHGYLPIALVLSGRIPSAIACDVNPAPLSSAEENIRANGLSDRIATRLCDGLEGVGPEDGDDIVIAGMGGELIARILGDCAWIKDGSKRLILQPMTRYEYLIRRLYREGFSVIAQKAAFADRKYYTVICAVYTGEAREASALDCCLGALDPADENSRRFLEKTLERLKKQSIGDPSLRQVADAVERVIHHDNDQRDP